MQAAATSFFTHAYASEDDKESKVRRRQQASLLYNFYATGCLFFSYAGPAGNWVFKEAQVDSTELIDILIDLLNPFTYIELPPPPPALLLPMYTESLVLCARLQETLARSDVTLCRLMSIASLHLFFFTYNHALAEDGQGGAQSGGDEDKEEDSRDPPVHNGRETGSQNHQPSGHLQKGVHQPRGAVHALS